MDLVTVFLQWLAVTGFAYIDGSWVDIASVLLALFYVSWQWRGRPPESRGPFLCRDIGAEVANASSLFPLLLLSLTIFSSKLTTILLSGNKIILSIAGFFALFALLEDRSVKKPDEFIGPLALVKKVARKPTGHGPANRRNRNPKPTATMGK